MRRALARMAAALVAAAAIGLAPAAPGADAPPQTAPRSFAYVLQAEGLAASRAAVAGVLAACDRDWIVLDAAFDGNDGGRWTRAEIEGIRAARPLRKVLAYVSIGEAEDYRAYWRKEWDADRDGKPDAAAPAFLGDENPAWKGNYKVRYWHAAWQQLMLDAVDGAMASGFDGVYLDLVDAFESFEYDAGRNEWRDDRVNPETGRRYREDMTRWVALIAARARRTRPDALVIPQNGSQLLAAKEYADAISGIGIEDLFTEGNRTQPEEHVRYVLEGLTPFNATGKPVLLIEYGRSAGARKRSAEGARQHGFVLLVTDRELKTLGRSGGDPETEEGGR